MRGKGGQFRTGETILTVQICVKIATHGGSLESLLFISPPPPFQPLQLLP